MFNSNFMIDRNMSLHFVYIEGGRGCSDLVEKAISLFENEVGIGALIKIKFFRFMPDDRQTDYLTRSNTPRFTVVIVLADSYQR